MTRATANHINNLRNKFRARVKAGAKLKCLPRILSTRRVILSEHISHPSGLSLRHASAAWSGTVTC